MNSPARTLAIAAITGLTVIGLAMAQSPNAARPIESTPGVSDLGQPAEGPGARAREAAQRIALADLQKRYLTSFNRVPSFSKRQVFIIPSVEIDRDSHLEIEREIHIMSHVIDNILKKPVSKIGGVFTVMDDFFGRDSHVTQVIYLEGYGALFFVDVDFPLAGPPQAQYVAEPNEPSEQVDTAWKQAERELYAPPGITEYKAIEDRSGLQYDAEKVELLKKNLVETLKHATNIRALKADESVILTIVGRVLGPTAVVRRGKEVQWIFSSGKWVPPAATDPTAASYLSPPPSVLTIRAKKSDIDAFSKGELDFTAFYARTQLLANWSGSAGTTQTSINRF